MSALAGENVQTKRITTFCRRQGHYVVGVIVIWEQAEGPHQGGACCPNHVVIENRLRQRRLTWAR
jgi:hypothetical protein